MANVVYYKGFGEMNKFCYVMILTHIFFSVYNTHSMLMLHGVCDKPSLFDERISLLYSYKKEYKKESLLDITDNNYLYIYSIDINI